jgi:hypothetical protein
MIDTAMFPWEECEEKAWRPIIDQPTNDRTIRRAKGCDCSYCQKEPASEPRKAELEKFDNIDPKVELSPEGHFLCAPYVYGYVFSARKWGKRLRIFPFHIR